MEQPTPDRSAHFVPEVLPEETAADRENDLGWGFDDTRFDVRPNGSVVLTGSRYNLCGFEMPDLIPYLGRILDAPLSAADQRETSVSLPPPSRDTARFVAGIREYFEPDQISTDNAARLRHGHGHTGLEIHSLLYGQLPRVPDLVLFPTNDEQVVELVKAANAHGVVLIPFGGGTNVTMALQCPEDEQRLIVSVDMRRMNRILWVDRENRLAKIQAGAPGRRILPQLAALGLTMGHEPDSVEFSTLGGWVATNCSGMKRNRYGNIEDIVVELTAVTSLGVVERYSQVPRESAGVDARRCLFGSEGALGIITSATVKLQPTPEAHRYESAIFPTFERGFAFLHEVERQGLTPTSIRLMDNVQFQFGMALRPAPSRWERSKSDAMKLVLTKLKGIDLNQCSLATVVFEGRRREVQGQERELKRLARLFGGVVSGAEHGERGYNLTFGIAYLRDFAFKHHIIAESFETSVSWSRTVELCERVKTRCAEKHRELGLPGKSMFSTRITQLYTTGVCVYFYMGFYAKGVSDPTHKYEQIENAAREEILACGGSLSHHHGVGKLRSRFLDKIQTPAMNDFNRRLKSALDPGDVFGCGNQRLSSPDRDLSALSYRAVNTSAK